MVNSRGGPKRTKLQRESDLATIAKLDRMGYTQQEIALHIGVSQPQVHNDLKKIKQRYSDIMVMERAAMLMEKALQYRDVRKEAAQAWEDSKKPAIKVVEEQTIGKPAKQFDMNGKEIENTDPPEMVVTKITTTNEESLPRNEYLMTILKTIEGERDLFGLDAPKKVDVKQDVFNWDILIDSIPVDGVVHDHIEEELKRIEQLPGPVPNGLHELPPPLEPPSENGHEGNGYPTAE